MPTVQHRTPVSVYNKDIGEFEAVERGTELPDDHPIVLDPANAYLFEEDPEPEKVDSVRIEQATAAPGERRNTRRPKKDG
jgi:hypothetical protein